MEIPLLNDIVIIFGLSIAVLYLCHRIRLPVIVGFFLTGILAGPHGLGLIKAVHEVEILAEIGIVLLLFTIGIEFSFKKLLEIKKSVLMGGSPYVAGKVIRTGEPIIVSDVSKEPDFYPEVDAKIGYGTRNMIEVPLKGC